jgi:hypothetical protein
MISNSEKTELIKKWVGLCPSVLVPEFRLGENTYLVPARGMTHFACLDANFGKISRIEQETWDDLISSHVQPTISKWCEANGFTEPHKIQGKWWAFPFGAVMPVPLDNPSPDDLFVSLSIHLKKLENDPDHKPRFIPGEYGGFYVRFQREL